MKEAKETRKKSDIDNLEIEKKPDNFKTEYQAGKVAFERGQYRQAVDRLESATSQIELNSAIGGEIQMWLVTAYEAAGMRKEAIALCKLLTRHPHLETRQKSSRILFILEAPQLKTRPEWLTQIPDLTALDDTQAKPAQVSALSSKKSQKPKEAKFTIEPMNLTQENAKDNIFIWIALIGAITILAALFWLS